MNSFITIELNSFLSEYVRHHPITGNPQLDQRLVMLTVSFLATYIVIVIAFGKDFIVDKYNEYFGIGNFLKRDKNKIAHVKINSVNDMYLYIEQFIPKLELNNNKNIFTTNSYNTSKNEISFCINVDGNNKIKPWKLNNIQAKLPQEENIDAIINDNMIEQFYIKFENRNINLCKFLHKNKSNGVSYNIWHLFIEKEHNESIESIYSIVDKFLINAKEYYYEKNKIVKYAEIKVYEIQSKEWVNVAILNKKESNTIIGQTCQDIFNDVQFFENDLNKIYKSLDIPYKRGYLLYGPPGTGKTSIIKSIASYTKKSIYKILYTTFFMGMK